MRICLIDNRSPNSPADGAAIYVSQLGPALASEHRVSILTLDANVPHLRQTIAAIRRMVAADHPDVVHLNNLSGLILWAALWAIEDRFPIAMSLHDYRLLEHWRGVNRSLTRRVGLVISPSNFALDRHRRYGFFAHAIEMVLPYGIETPEAESPSPLAGEGRGGGYIIFRSSWPEPFPIAVQDAFRSGKVVIASHIGGVPEMVRDGVNGLLVEPGDEAGIAAAIDRLQQSPELAARLRASAFETARLYDMRFHIARLTDAYRRLLTAERTGDFGRAA